MTQVTIKNLHIKGEIRADELTISRSDCGGLTISAPKNLRITSPFAPQLPASSALAEVAADVAYGTWYLVSDVTVWLWRHAVVPFFLVSGRVAGDAYAGAVLLSAHASVRACNKIVLYNNQLAADRHVRRVEAKLLASHSTERRLGQ